jgi:hypothetical protein
VNLHVKIVQLRPSHSMRRLAIATVGLTAAVGIGVLGVANLVPTAPASADPIPVCSAGTCTVTYTSPGLGQTWTVPSGVSTESFTLTGGAGGEGGNFGGLPSVVSGSVSAAVGSTITVDVGGGGISWESGGIGGVNGGGNGSFTSGSGGGGGGGGATDIKVGGTAQVDRVLVAGGAGGGGGNGDYLLPGCSTTEGGAGGAGDGVGATAQSLSTPDAQLFGGAGGGAGDAFTPGFGGIGGTAPATITDCSNDPNIPTSNGETGVFGTAAGQGGGGDVKAGGGGGGGYFGGGQGGGPARTVDYTASWGGGGGGSSYGGGVSDYVRLDNADPGNAGNGTAVITYADPAATTTTTTTTTTVPTTPTTTTPPSVTPTTVATIPPAPPVTPPAAAAAGASVPVVPAAAPVVLAGAPAADPSAPLAFTGLNILPLLISGLALIVIGAACLGGASRRRRHGAAEGS